MNALNASEAARLYQAALEYRRTARERYSTDDELAECDEAVAYEHGRVELAMLDQAAQR